MPCLRCLVTGRVQGVWYRASTQREAQALGITGHALNLPDGRVEVRACGDATALEQLQAWLWQGPPAAEVVDVQCESIECERPAAFQTG